MNALPTKGFEPYAEGIKERLVLLPEEVFGYFVENATVVEPHVRIDDATGTAATGGLFYVENVPPETLFVSLMMVSADRRKNNSKMTAEQIRELLAAGPDSEPGGLDQRVVQMGGDATTGRGLMALRVLK